MTLHTALISLLLLQATPAARSQAPKATVAGVVLNANGEPLPNIRVALGRTDVSIGPFAQMVAGERPPAEVTIPAEALAGMADTIAGAVQNGLAEPELAVQAAAFKSIPADIHELIASPSGGVVVVPKSAPPTLTDERGRFSFNDVEPGTYKVMFSGNGYARQDYGQRTSAGGVPMTLAPGQAKTDIVMRMMAVAALSGRIRDAVGQPVAGVTVQLFRFTYDETGQRKTQRVTGTRTDDRGEYRMYYLSPGRYYMSAGNQPGENQQNIGFTSALDALLYGPGYSSANRVAQNYTLMYYPGVPDENSATPIDVQSGADVQGIDVFVNPHQSYRVRGRVVDSRTGQPPPNAFVSVNVQNPDPTNLGIRLFRGNANYRPADGSFEVQDVSAGAYTLSASLPSPPPTRPPDIDNMSPAERNAYFQAQQAAQNALPKAFATINVVNVDVEGVVLTLGVSMSLAGRLRVESNTLPADAFGFMRVQMKGGSAPSDPVSGGGPQPRPITADGTFRIDNLWPGEYRVSMAGLPPGFYLKEARFADTDVLNGPLRLIGQDSQPLDLLISSNVGAIDGVAVDAAGQPVAGAQVVLIPGRSRERAELFRPVTADLSGRFTIPSVAPGEYILAAWEAMEPNAYYDPNSIRQAEGSGKAVRVSESSTQTVNVSVIPVAAR